jgi:2-keto-3-deoxy-L-rhamnonate aldolase RhmA
MTENRCKEKIAAGQPAFGFWLQFPSPELVEFIGLLGLDYVVIDAEHFAFGRETTQSLVRAAQRAYWVLSSPTPTLRKMLRLPCEQSNTLLWGSEAPAAWLGPRTTA